jgi:endonuclease YncB( thermonuclease family)
VILTSGRLFNLFFLPASGGATKIRFAGIDAPETDQACLDAKDERMGDDPQVSAEDPTRPHPHHQ